MNKILEFKKKASAKIIDLRIQCKFLLSLLNVNTSLKCCSSSAQYVSFSLISSTCRHNKWMLKLLNSCNTFSVIGSKIQKCVFWN